MAAGSKRNRLRVIPTKAPIVGQATKYSDTILTALTVSPLRKRILVDPLTRATIATHAPRIRAMMNPTCAPRTVLATILLRRT
jgi:hypothetical protein